jgi:hypothetical protein
MRALARSVKVGSLALWSSVLTLTAAVGFAGSGCIIIDEHDDDWEEEEWDDGHHDDDDTPPPATEPQLVVIDAGAVITAEPGEGVGLFVEYQAGGLWRLWTSCDTNYSNAVCAFDIVVSVDTSSELIAITGEELEGLDEAGIFDGEQGAGYFLAETDSNMDGMTVETTPGAILRVDLILDGQPEARFIYWYGEGVLHQGAPTNPIDFEPSEP